MKKSFSLVFLSILLAFGLTSCGSNQEDLRSNDNTLRNGKAAAAKTNDASGSSQHAAPTFDDKTKLVRLNSGYDMPVLGLGTWALNDAEAENSVYHALIYGYRLIDTASYYGNAKGVGRGIKKSGVPREEIFVTTKLYMNEYSDAQNAIDKELEELDLDYIDLLLLHHPSPHDVQAYQVMESAVRKGKIRSIGLSNYYAKEFDAFISQVQTMPALVQNEIHPYYQDREVREHIKKYGVVIQAWYPFGGRGHTRELFDNETIEEIATAHGKSSAQVILRWNFQNGIIAIPGSNNPDHIRENLNIFDFSLRDVEMEKLNSLNQNKKFGWY